MGKFDDAFAAFREAETLQNKFLAEEPDKTKFRSELASLYIAFGDLYAECKPDKTDSELKSDYKSGATCVTAKNRRRLEEARRWYEKTINTLAPFEKNAAKPEDVKNLRNAGEKLSFINSRLQDLTSHD